MSNILCMSILSTMEADASSSIFEWVVFLAYKYWDLFVEGTKVTLYVAIIGTIVGFVLGFLIGVIQNIKLSPEDNIVEKIS